MGAMRLPAGAQIPDAARSPSRNALERKAINLLDHGRHLCRDFSTVMQFHPKVVAIEPARFPVACGGARPLGLVFPDLLVSYRVSSDGGERIARCLVSLAYAHEADSGPSSNAFGWMARTEGAARKAGFGFRVFTAPLFRGPCLRAARLLSPFRSLPPRPWMDERILLALSRLQQSTPLTLAANAGNGVKAARVWLSRVWFLMGQGKIGADYSHPLHMLAPIHPLEPHAAQTCASHLILPDGNQAVI